MAKPPFNFYAVSGLVDTEPVRQYTSGVQELDTFIHGGYKDLEENNVTALSAVFLGNTIVGMYALSSASTQAISKNKQRELAFGDAGNYNSLPLLSIDHLSVNEPYQYESTVDHPGLGTAILRHIFRIVVDLRMDYGVAIAGIIVDSLPGPVDFYLSRGFVYFNEHEENAINKETYKLVISYDKIEKACEL